MLYNRKAVSLFGQVGYAHDGTKTLGDILLRLLMLVGLGVVACLLHASYALAQLIITGADVLEPSSVSWGQLRVVGATLYFLGWFGETIALAFPPMRRPHYSSKQVVRGD